MPLYSIIGLLHAVQLGQVGRHPIPRRCAAHPRSLSEATNSTPQGAYPAWGSFLWRHRDCWGSWPRRHRDVQKIKSFNRLPGGGIPLIQLNMKVASAKTVKKGIPKLKSAGLITDTG